MEPPDPVTLPPEGRVFRHIDRTTLADVAPLRRARLDALARWLQDAAYEDVLDSGLDDGAGVWIVRRMTVRVHRFPQLLDPIEVATFCSGVAPLWAERSSLVSSRAEIEHRAPAAPGEARVLSDGELRWVTDPAGTVVATLAAAPLG